MKPIMETVKETLSAYLSIKPEEIGDEDRLYESLGIDSAAIVSLLLELEQACGVAFDLEELTPEHLASVRSLSLTIQALKDDE
ncbi:MULTISPECIES: acyl carrier protein [Paenibacillus]|uniref:Carrier domain-containing protein n=3 Tax=Paenibacillus TaxID=44249 RepID=A0A081P3V8_9BACL|nr:MULTISPECIES: acyl carrier protein [Paenibacillus]KEQ25381.1 hypothetical protein ET33_01170 [Paenibacillus tyrfis]PUA35243.1 acyl carrier protein [Paenibacillus elgii]GMX63815.1 hypothetical protein Elgi_03600 [Paenibacillus elgii]